MHHGMINRSTTRVDLYKTTYLLGLSLMLTVLQLFLPASLRAQAAAHFDSAEVIINYGYLPIGVAVDGSGNVFAANDSNNTVTEILAAGGYTTVKSLGSGFKGPQGVAVDRNGNVFVADSGNSAVKEILAASGYTTVITLGSGFNNPTGVAVDASGNVFVADGYNSVKEIPAATGYTTVLSLAGPGASINPIGVAVDASDNVYFADFNNSAVEEIPAAGGPIQTLGSGFLHPEGVAVDGSGNVIVADFGNYAVKEIMAAGGYTAVNTISSAFLGGPGGVAVDSYGNIFATDSAYSRVVELKLASGDFGTVAVGQQSGTMSLTYTFDSAGTIGSPIALTEGAAGLDFALAGTGNCISNGNAHTYSIGDTCTVDVTFTPKFASFRKGAVVLQDGSGNRIATGYIHGIGSGPQTSFQPGSQSTIASGYLAGVAVDGNGNVFVTDLVNNAVDEILAASGYTTILTLGGGFSHPNGIALDGSGNVFVTDGDSGVVKEILAGGGYTTVVPLASGFTGAYGLAVDGSGNLFVADLLASTVNEILAAGGYTTVNTLGNGFHDPYGVAVDGSGNVFVADTYNNAVKEIPAAGGYTTVIPLGSGFSNPRGVALDGGGNVYVTDAYNNAVKEILAAGGYTTVNTLMAFNSPYEIAVDGSGNLFVTDGSSKAAKLDFADPPSLSFATPTFVGSTDSTDPAQTVTIQNIGSAPLLFLSPLPSYVSEAVLTSSGAADCTELSPLQLAPSTSCTLGIEFAPMESGAVTGQISILDDSLHTTYYAKQSITVLGTGVSLQSQAITFPAPGAQTYNSPLVLAATATSGLPVTYTVSSGPATLSGNTLTFTGTGSVTVQASQAGNANYSAAIPVSETFTVNPASQTITFANPGPQNSTMPLTLAATASSGLVVSYAVSSGPGKLSGSTLTFTGTGSVTVQATQAGNADYNAATPVSVTFTVANLVAAAPTFSLASGTYYAAQTVTISDATSGVTIYYTADGSFPTTASASCTSPCTLSVSSTSTMRAMALGNGSSQSSTSFAVYTIAAVSPTFSLAGGTYTTPQTVTIADSTPGVTVYYTTNGTLPTTSSTACTNPCGVSITATTTLRAMAAGNGISPSNPTAAVYTIAALAPTFSPATGTYNAPQAVTLSDATPGVSIYYMTNGSFPTTSSPSCTSPCTIEVSTTSTVRAMALGTGISQSSTSFAAYTLAANNPTFSLPSGSYTGAQAVTISDTGTFVGLMIYYTTDGSIPTTSSPNSCTSPCSILVSATTSFKAMATAPGITPSGVAVASYTIH